MKPKQPHEISWIIEDKIRNGPYTNMEKSHIKYIRVQPINGRMVVFGQLFHIDGSKLFPDRVVDAPLTQILQFAIDEDYEIANAEDVLFDLIRDHALGA